MNNNKKRRQPKTIWDFLRECPLVSLILLSVIGYTLYALSVLWVANTAADFQGSYALYVCHD